MSTAFSNPRDIRRILRQVLAASTADETELVWFERQRGCTALADTCELTPPVLSILVRVVEGRRLGWYRADTADANELENAVRLALALAKSEPPLKRTAVFPQPKGAALSDADETLHDPAIEALTSEEATALLRATATGDERASLRWSTSRLTIANSHGLEQSTAVTEATAEVMTGTDAGAGYAAGSSRSLSNLDLQCIFGRAHRLAVDAPDSSALERAWRPPPLGAMPAVLAPEAVIAVLDVINAHALSGRAFVDGSSLLSQHRNIQVFDRRFHLRDDGRAPEGLAFPFDFEGVPKVAIDLIQGGVPTMPALNRHQGQMVGLSSSGQSLGGEDSMFGNLFLEPGDADEATLLEAADGGIFVGWIEAPVCLDPVHLTLWAVLRGVRRIENGRLGAALPDLVWEDSLLQALARLENVGNVPVTRTMPSTPLGSISAAALALKRMEGLAPWRSGGVPSGNPTDQDDRLIVALGQTGTEG